MLVADELLIGFRMDGRVIRSYAGGSEGAPEGGVGDGGGDGGEGGEGEGGSGSDAERLQRALDSERSLAKQARDALRPWRSLAQELGVKGPDEVRSRLQALTADQQAQAESMDKVRAEVLNKANQRIVKAEIKAMAANDFADPADAVLNLKVGDYDVDDDGNVDEKRIKSDLAELLKRKPHLAKTSKKVDFEGGPRSTAKGPVDMNERIRRLARR